MGIQQGRLPADPRWLAIGDVCKLVNGDAYKDSDWSLSGTPIIRIQNLNDAQKPFNYWAGSLDDRVRVSDGDLLFAWSGTPGTSFGAHIWRRGEAVLNQHIFRVDEDPTLVDRAWLSEAFNYSLDDIIGKSHGGVGLRHITKRELEQVQLPVPPLATQRRIVSALAERRLLLNSARSSADAQIREVEALSQRIVAETIGPGIRLPEDQVAAPRGWRWRRLLEVAQLESGHTPSRRVPQWWGGDVPWLALPDIRELDGKTAFATIESTNADGLANSSARLLPTRTVCLSRTASVGFVTVLGKPMATSQDFVNWICGSGLEPWFLARALIASRAYLVSLASGAIHKTIYVPTVKALTICLPSEVTAQAGIVKALAERTAALANARAVATEQLEQLRALEPALLRAAFSGAL